MFSGLSKQRRRDQEQDYTEDEGSSLDSGVVVLPKINPFAEDSRSAGRSQPTSQAPRRSSGRAATRHQDEEEQGVTVLSTENPFAEHDERRGSGHRDRVPSPAPASRQTRTRSYLFSDPSSEDAPGQGRSSGRKSTHHQDRSPSPPPRTHNRNAQPQHTASTSRGNSRPGANFIRPVELNIDIGTGQETDPLVVQWVDDPTQADQDQSEEQGRRPSVPGHSGHRHADTHGGSHRGGGHRPSDYHSTVDPHFTSECSSSSSSSSSSSEDDEPAPAPAPPRPSLHPDRPSGTAHLGARPSVIHPSTDQPSARPSVIHTARPSIRFDDLAASRPAVAPRQRASSADRAQVRPRLFSDTSDSEDSLPDTRHRHAGEHHHHHHGHHDRYRHHDRHHHHRHRDYSPDDWSDFDDYSHHHHRPHYNPYHHHHYDPRDRQYHGRHHHGGHHHHYGGHHPEGHWYPRHYPPPPPMPLEWMENYAPLPLQPPRSYGPYPNAPAPQRFSNIPDLKSLLDQCKEPYSALAVPPASILNDARAQFHGPATSEPMPPPPPLPEPEDSQKWENGYKFLEREQKDTRKFMQLVEYQELHPYYSDQDFQRLSSVVKVRFGELRGKEFVNRVHVVPRGRLALGTLMKARPKLDVDLVIPGDYVLRRWNIKQGDKDEPMTTASALGLDTVSIARGEIDGKKLEWVLRAVWEQFTGAADAFIFPKGDEDASDILSEWCDLYKGIEGGNRLRLKVLEKDHTFINLYVKVAVTLNGQQMVVGVDQTSAKWAGKYQMIKTLRAPGISLREAPLSPIDRSAIIALNWWQISKKHELSDKHGDKAPQIRTSHFLLALSALHSLPPKHDLYVARATESGLPFSLARMLDTMRKILEYLTRAYKPPQTMISIQPAEGGEATEEYAFPLSSCTRMDALYTQAASASTDFKALEEVLKEFSEKIKKTVAALGTGGMHVGEFTVNEK